MNSLIIDGRRIDGRPGTPTISVSDNPKYVSVSDRGWGLTTLDMFPDNISYLKGATGGEITHTFKMKYSLFTKDYDVKVNYSCDKEAKWRPFEQKDG